MPNNSGINQNGIKAILFDLDGTLINTMESDYLAFQTLMKNKLGVVISLEKMQSLFGIPTKTILREYVPEADVETLFADLLKIKFKYRNKDNLFSGISSLLMKLKDAHIKMAVVTSQFNQESYMTREQFNLGQYFDVWITSDSCPKNKPDPAPIELALKELSIKCDQALMVGDSTFDVDAGNAAGTMTGAALWGPRDHSALLSRNCTYTFYKPEDVEALFNL
jgi:pyrophosphatase PpaX